MIVDPIKDALEKYKSGEYTKKQVYEKLMYQVVVSTYYSPDDAKVLYELYGDRIYKTLKPQPDGSLVYDDSELQALMESQPKRKQNEKRKR